MSWWVGSGVQEALTCAEQGGLHDHNYEPLPLRALRGLSQAEFRMTWCCPLSVLHDNWQYCFSLTSGQSGLNECRQQVAPFTKKMLEKFGSLCTSTHSSVKLWQKYVFNANSDGKHTFWYSADRGQMPGDEWKKASVSWKIENTFNKSF